MIETTTARYSYHAHNYIALDRWLRVRRDRRTVVEFNVAHVVRVEWARRPGVKR